jgi:hypothetical protein
MVNLFSSVGRSYAGRSLFGVWAIMHLKEADEMMLNLY